MALEHRLDLKLAQKFVLTPQLQQAIKFLQMPQLELSQAISQELIENPLLEEDPVEEESDNDLSMEERELSKEVTDENENNSDTEPPIEQLLNFSVDEYFEERASDGRDLGYFNPDVVTPMSFEQYTSRIPDLHDYLLWQLRFSDAQESLKQAGEIVIGNIDENGYLISSDEDIAQQEGMEIDFIRRAIRLIQDFDPPGIAARDPKECFILQLRELGLSGTLAEKIVADSLDSLSRKKYQEIARQHNASIEDVMSAVRIIEGLEPKPARNLSSSTPVYVVPDVFVIKSEEGYRIILNDEGLPKLRINSYYRNLLRNKEAFTKEDKHFFEDKLRSAIWLIKSLDQREKTIARVTECIVNFQREFFDKGATELKPLNLRDVAANIGMHESTISRVTSTKYLACSHGVFGFRFFFSSALQSGNGSISSTTVKDYIKKTVSEEDEMKPLSDQDISRLLRESYNITIARRTVAKYREEIKIPPQSKRKRRDRF